MVKVLSGKWAALTVAAVLACSVAAVAGCSSQAASSGSASASTSSGSASASAEASDSSAAASMANPWSTAADAAEAAKGAGVGTFTLPEGDALDLGELFEVAYSYMDGMAQARMEFPASAIIVRKATADSSTGGDITGDYNAYAYEWTETIDGITLHCSGNRQGDSTKTYWTANGYDYSLVAEGLGGDTDFGLNTERLTSFVRQMA